MGREPRSTGAVQHLLSGRRMRRRLKNAGWHSFTEPFTVTGWLEDPLDLETCPAHHGDCYRHLWDFLSSFHHFACISDLRWTRAC